MKKEVVLFGLIFLLGVFLRLYKIDSIPPGLHGDEAQSGLEATKILKGAPYSPYSPEVYGQTTFYFYLVALIFKLFKISATSIRLTSAIIGILTIPLFYLLTRYLFNKQTALLSTFFLAVSRWHIHLSRLGLMAIMTTLFQAGTFLFLLKGLKTKKIENFLLAGIFLSLGLNSYMAFRFVPFILLFFLIFVFFQEKSLIKKNVVGLSLFFMVAVFISLPLSIYTVKNWNIFMGRMKSISIFSNYPLIKIPSVILKNLRGAILMFHIRGSTWPHKNLPGAPMLDPITGAVFLVGLALAFKRIKKPIYFLLLINLLVMLAISVFSESVYPPAGDPIRSNGVIITVFTLAGVGAYALWARLKKFRLILIALLMMVSLLNFQAYFFTFARHPAVWHDFHTLPVEVAKVANSNPNVYIYLLSDWFYSNYLSIRFLSPQFSGEDFFNELGKYSPKDNLLPLKQHLEKDSIFIVLPFYNQYLRRLKEVYPEGKIKNYYGGANNQLFFSSFFVSQKIAGEKITNYD